MPLIEGDDGLPANEIRIWATQKHNLLRWYLDICRAARMKFIGRAGATYIDLFCATGRGKILDSNEWVDGSPVAAWKISAVGGAPFSEMLISDVDPVARSACAQRLRKLGAPVREIPGTAVEAARTIADSVNPKGLHFAFVDPYSLGALNFDIIRTLSKLKSIDMMIHLSAMDLQRNLEANVGFDDTSYDEFAPGWREHVDVEASKAQVRARVVEYWRGCLAKLGTLPAPEMKLIKGSKNQRLYWLLLASHHPLARDFWGKAIGVEGQGKFDF